MPKGQITTARDYTISSNDKKLLDKIWVTLEQFLEEIIDPSVKATNLDPKVNRL